MDGNIEKRTATLSVLNGPPSAIQLHHDADEEEDTVARWLRTRIDGGHRPQGIAVFVRSSEELGRAKNAVVKSGLAVRILDDTLALEKEAVSVRTMHLAKGLEFKAVVVMACDEGIVPLEERIESLGDDADLEDAYTTERQLFYVACTRARDWLLVTGVKPASEYIDDLRSGAQADRRSYPLT